MKPLFMLGFAAFSSAAAVAQSTAVINQLGKQPQASVVQPGAGNTAVVIQSASQLTNRVTITQSGSGNVATINQGGNPGGANAQNSVYATQSGDGETIIDQTKDGNSIHVYQSGIEPKDRKKTPTKKNERE